MNISKEDAYARIVIALFVILVGILVLAFCAPRQVSGQPDHKVYLPVVIGGEQDQDAVISSIGTARNVYVVGEDINETIDRAYKANSPLIIEDLCAQENESVVAFSNDGEKMFNREYCRLDAIDSVYGTLLNEISVYYCDSDVCRMARFSEEQ